MRYIFSKRSILGCFLCIIGTILTIQGLIVRYNLTNIKESYRKFEIKNGRYIEFDIVKEDLIGSYYTNQNGSIQYYPYCNTDALSSYESYVVSVNEDSDYYVSLLVVQKYLKDFNHMLDSNDTYHIVGKFEKLRSTLLYDVIAECLGIDDRSKLDQVLSTDHQIRIVDLNDEKKILYKGLSILLIGLFLFVITLEKEKVDIETDNS